MGDKNKKEQICKACETQISASVKSGVAFGSVEDAQAFNRIRNELLKKNQSA